LSRSHPGGWEISAIIYLVTLKGVRKALYIFSSLCFSEQEGLCIYRMGALVAAEIYPQEKLFHQGVHKQDRFARRP
jgi:hypothetical protein